MLQLVQQAHGSPALGSLPGGGGATCHMETPHHIYLLTELPTALHITVICPFRDLTVITAYLQCATMAAEGAKPEDAIHAAWMLFDCTNAARPTESDNDWMRRVMGHHAVVKFACESMGSGAEGVASC